MVRFSLNSPIKMWVVSLIATKLTYFYFGFTALALYSTLFSTCIVVSMSMIQKNPDPLHTNPSIDVESLLEQIPEDNSTLYKSFVNWIRKMQKKCSEKWSELKEWCSELSFKRLKCKSKVKPPTTKSEYEISNSVLKVFGVLAKIVDESVEKERLSTICGEVYNIDAMMDLFYGILNCKNLSDWDTLPEKINQCYKSKGKIVRLVKKHVNLIRQNITLKDLSNLRSVVATVDKIQSQDDPRTDPTQNPFNIQMGNVINYYIKLVLKTIQKQGADSIEKIEKVAKLLVDVKKEVLLTEEFIVENFKDLVRLIEDSNFKKNIKIFGQENAQILQALSVPQDQIIKLLKSFKSNIKKVSSEKEKYDLLCEYRRIYEVFLQNILHLRIKLHLRDVYEHNLFFTPLFKSIQNYINKHNFQKPYNIKVVLDEVFYECWYKPLENISINGGSSLAIEFITKPNMEAHIENMQEWVTLQETQLSKFISTIKEQAKNLVIKVCKDLNIESTRGGPIKMGDLSDLSFLSKGQAAVEGKIGPANYKFIEGFVPFLVNKLLYNGGQGGFCKGSVSLKDLENPVTSLPLSPLAMLLKEGLYKSRKDFCSFMLDQIAIPYYDEWCQLELEAHATEDLYILKNLLHYPNSNPTYYHSMCPQHYNYIREMAEKIYDVSLTSEMFNPKDLERKTKKLFDDANIGLEAGNSTEWRVSIPLKNGKYFTFGNVMQKLRFAQLKDMNFNMIAYHISLKVQGVEESLPLKTGSSGILMMPLHTTDSVSDITQQIHFLSLFAHNITKSHFSEEALRTFAIVLSQAIKKYPIEFKKKYKKTFDDNYLSKQNIVLFASFSNFLQHVQQVHQAGIVKDAPHLKEREKNIVDNIVGSSCIHRAFLLTFNHNKLTAKNPFLHSCFSPRQSLFEHLGNPFHCSIGPMEQRGYNQIQMGGADTCFSQINLKNEPRDQVHELICQSICESEKEYKLRHAEQQVDDPDMFRDMVSGVIGDSQRKSLANLRQLFGNCGEGTHFDTTKMNTKVFKDAMDAFFTFNYSQRKIFISSIKKLCVKAKTENLNNSSIAGEIHLEIHKIAKEKFKASSECTGKLGFMINFWTNYCIAVKKNKKIQSVDDELFLVMKYLRYRENACRQVLWESTELFFVDSIERERREKSVPSPDLQNWWAEIIRVNNSNSKIEDATESGPFTISSHIHPNQRILACALHMRDLREKPLQAVSFMQHILLPKLSKKIEVEEKKGFVKGSPQYKALGRLMKCKDNIEQILCCIEDSKKEMLKSYVYGKRDWLDKWWHTSEKKEDTPESGSLLLQRALANSWRKQVLHNMHQCNIVFQNIAIVQFLKREVNSKSKFSCMLDGSELKDQTIEFLRIRHSKETKLEKHSSVFILFNILLKKRFYNDGQESAFSGKNLSKIHKILCDSFEKWSDTKSQVSDLILYNILLEKVCDSKYSDLVKMHPALRNIFIDQDSQRKKQKEYALNLMDVGQPQEQHDKLNEIFEDELKDIAGEGVYLDEHCIFFIQMADEWVYQIEQCGTTAIPDVNQNEDLKITRLIERKIQNTRPLFKGWHGFGIAQNMGYSGISNVGLRMRRKARELGSCASAACIGGTSQSSSSGTTVYRGLQKLSDTQTRKNCIDLNFGKNNQLKFRPYIDLNVPEVVKADGSLVETDQLQRPTKLKLFVSSISSTLIKYSEYFAETIEGMSGLFGRKTAFQKIDFVTGFFNYSSKNKELNLFGGLHEGMDASWFNEKEIHKQCSVMGNYIQYKQALEDKNNSDCAVIIIRGQPIQFYGIDELLLAFNEEYADMLKNSKIIKVHSVDQSIDSKQIPIDLQEGHISLSLSAPEPVQQEAQRVINIMPPEEVFESGEEVCEEGLGSGEEVFEEVLGSVGATVPWLTAEVNAAEKQAYEQRKKQLEYYAIRSSSASSASAAVAYQEDQVVPVVFEDSDSDEEDSRGEGSGEYRFGNW